MMLGFVWSWPLDGWIVAVAVLCAVACATLGNYLVLRRMSMLGDAISHAVLPGLAIAFFISESRASLPMFIGAVVVGILTAFFTQWIKEVGQVDEGASMGVVFTSLFALGLVLIVQAADQVDLDASCVLYGAIELTPLDTVSLGGREVPRAALTLGGVCILNILFVTLFYKELKITSFDPSLATTLGIRASWMHYVLMVLVAVTSVASFESVGSVLVVAMFVVPPATAFMLTDRLSLMIPISLLVGAASAVLGHVGAISIPEWFGYQSTTTAGMMAVVVGCLFFIAMLFGPRQGLLIKFVRQRSLSFRILSDDVLAFLFRARERDEAHVARETICDQIYCSRTMLRLVVFWLQRQGAIESSGKLIGLSPTGVARAQNLVRSHRLWEQYLQDHAGVSPGRLHAQAERFEHFTDPQLREQLGMETDRPELDPHGSPIPSEQREA